MQTFDFSPLYRSTVGFDRLNSLLASVAQREQNQSSFPPYNIERLEEDQYQITMAVAGFVQDELEITSEHQTLTVRGRQADSEDGRNYLYRGIAARDFERRFQLADHVKVTSARMENGLLHIELVREIPEAMKPRSISIQGGSSRLLNAERPAANSSSHRVEVASDTSGKDTKAA